jgi:hypothetical protein
MATILKLAIKNIYPNYQHYTDIDPNVNTRPHISCRNFREKKTSGSDPGSFITL